MLYWYNITVTAQGMEFEGTKFLEDFEAHLSNPEDYLNPTPELRARCLAGVKTLFDALQKYCRDTNSQANSSIHKSRVGKTKKLTPIPTGPLPELYVEGFDVDQIWEQIQLVNEPLLAHLTKQVEKISKWDLQRVTEGSGGSGHHSRKNEEVAVSDSDSGGVGDLESAGEGEQEEEEAEYEDFSGEDGDADELESREEIKKKEKKRSKEGGRRTVVDDRFFKLAEMEEFLEKVEREQQQRPGLSTCTETLFSMF